MIIVPRQRWTLAAWLLIGAGLLYVNVAGTAWVIRWDFGPGDFGAIRVWGWPFIHSNRMEGGGQPCGMSPYLIIVDIAVCAAMLACAGNFLERKRADG